MNPKAPKATPPFTAASSAASTSAAHLPGGLVGSLSLEKTIPMSYSLNSLKGDIIRDYIGDYFMVNLWGYLEFRLWFIYPSLQILSALGPIDCTYYLHGATWIPRYTRIHYSWPFSVVSLNKGTVI